MTAELSVAECECFNSLGICRNGEIGFAAGTGFCGDIDSNFGLSIWVRFKPFIMPD